MARRRDAARPLSPRLASPSRLGAALACPVGAVLATENLWRAWSFQPLVIGGRPRRDRLLPPRLAAAAPAPAEPCALDTDPAVRRRRRGHRAGDRLPDRRDRGELPAERPHAAARAHRRPRHRPHARRRPWAADRVLPAARPARAAGARRLAAPAARLPAPARGSATPSGSSSSWSGTFPRFYEAALHHTRLARPHAPELRRRRPARLDADHRPVASPPAHPRTSGSATRRSSSARGRSWPT